MSHLERADAHIFGQFHISNLIIIWYGIEGNNKQNRKKYK